jgi:hypothetical protein
MGQRSLYNNTTASGNTAVGYQAGYANTTGAVTAFGYQALQANTTGNGDAFGSGSLLSQTTGAANVGLGFQTLRTTTTGSGNTASGYQAMVLNTTGGQNVANGYQALFSNTTASSNTAVGYQAGYTTTTGTQNTYLGESAGYSNSTSGQNTLLGEYSGYGVTGGVNTFVGRAAGYLVTTGSKNSILGSYSGNQGGLDIRTASNYIVLSDGDGNPRGIFDASGRLLIGTTTASLSYGGGLVAIKQSGDNGIQIEMNSNNSGIAINQNTTGGTYFQVFGYKSTTVGSIQTNGTTTSYNITSDQRLKTNIVDAPAGNIDYIKVRSFDWKSNGSHQTYGFIAQELIEAAPYAVTKGITEEDMLSVDYSKLVPMMIKEIQDLKQRIATLESK